MQRQETITKLTWSTWDQLVVGNRLLTPIFSLYFERLERILVYLP